MIKPTNSRSRPMSAAAFRHWREYMGWSERDAAVKLGISRSALRVVEERGGSLCIALACAALVNRVEPILTRDDL